MKKARYAESLIDGLLPFFAYLFVNATIIMFVAAVVAKRTTVFAPIGYVESLAWAAGYGLVKSLIHSSKSE